jgi:hypothetical protein
MILRPGAAHKPAAQTAPVVSGAPAAPAAAPPPAAPAHMATSPGMASQQPPATPAAAAAAAPAAPALPLGAIQILSGGNAGKEMELTKTLTTLGKPGVQVAVIARRPHGYFITHVEGANFPVVNGSAIGTQAHQLRDHDVIELAGIKMEFFLKS